MNFVFLASRQLYFSCIVEYYILIFWQNKVMMFGSLKIEGSSSVLFQSLQLLLHGLSARMAPVHTLRLLGAVDGKGVVVRWSEQSWRNVFLMAPSKLELTPFYTFYLYDSPLKNNTEYIIS